MSIYVAGVAGIMLENRPEMKWAMRTPLLNNVPLDTITIDVVIIDVFVTVAVKTEMMIAVDTR